MPAINCLNDFLSQVNNEGKECKECREVKPLDQFRLHAGNKDGYDIYYKACRKLQYKRITLEKGKGPPMHRNKSLESLDRLKKANFIFYMKQRPHYFKYCFRKDSTDVNIQEAADSLNIT